MDIGFIPEPELEFGDGKHIDIRFGLMNYRPFDYKENRAPKEIRLGIVGTNTTIEGLRSWIRKISNGVDAKRSNQPKLFPHFPGFGPETSLPASLVIDSKFERTIQQTSFSELNCKSLSELNRQLVELYINEIKYLGERFPVDVFLCAIPEIQIELTEAFADSSSWRRRGHKYLEVDFHDLLKSRAMAIGAHTQLVLPSTYDSKKLRRQRRYQHEYRKPQDEATRSWNLYTAIYYKAKGIPWRLVRDVSKFTTCYVGVSFYRNLEGTRLRTSIAQVFNERGEGVIVRGGAARVSKQDRQPHLNEEDSYRLLSDALESYRREHGNLPARVVVHKSSSYSNNEYEGFRQALRDNRINMVDLITLRSTRTRLFRTDAYPPLRGTMLSLDNMHHLLYTRGSVDFYETYPGQYIPMPLEIDCHMIEQTPRYLAEEILGLTKMNWNKTQFDGKEPITLWASREVGAILRHVSDDGVVQPRYSFYM